MASFVNTGISLATYESFMAMFTPLRGVNWQALDMLDPQTTRAQLDESIVQVLNQVNKKTFAQYKKNTDAFRRRFVTHFGLLSETSKPVEVYPAFRFDVVLNSHAATPQELAKQIVR